MADQTVAEASQLRNCINNLIGIVALPAVWSGSSPAEIVRTLLDMLVGMLRLDFVYLRLNHSQEESPLEVCRYSHADAATSVPPAITDLLRSLSASSMQASSRHVRNVFGDQNLSVTSVPLGIDGEVGTLLAGSSRADFPARTETLLLSVAANQVTVWLQGARLLSKQKRVAEELDQKVAQRTEELAAANRELQQQIAKQQSISLENARLYRDLDDREQKIRRLIDANVIGIVIWDLDGRILDANDAFLRMVGYDRSDLRDGLGWLAITPPEWQEVHARIEAAELITTGMMQPREKEYFRKDGTRVPVMIGAACFEGQPNQGVAYIVDLSVQKRAEEALRRSETYLTEAQRQTHTGSCAIDGASRETVYWSDEMFRLFDFDPRHGPPAWEQFLDRIHPEDRGTFQSANEKTFRTKASCDIEFRIIRPDGTIKYIHAIGHPVLGRGGELVQVLGTMVDVTEHKRAEEERERLRQVRADLAHITRVSTIGELTASLAHEIKQPIGAAVTNAEACMRFINRSEPDLPEAREAASEMIKDAKRAADIIDRVRSLYQKGASKFETIKLNQMIEEMVTMMGTEAERNTVTIRTDLAKSLPNVMGDRVQLQQALMNLVLNGVEAMRDTGGELCITSTLSKDKDTKVIISVSDTGVGLPAADVEKIFDAFFTTKSQGTGLGLAITRSIVRSHGGNIWAEPNSEHGAIFKFTLPINETAAV